MPAPSLALQRTTAAVAGGASLAIPAVADRDGGCPTPVERERWHAAGSGKILTTQLP